MKMFFPRLRAAGIHFLISAVVVAIVVAATVLWWFPGQLAWAAGLVSMLTILLLVDLVLGPAMTFLVFLPGKKSLKFDLAVVALIQVAALIFGISEIYQARPVYLAFVIDRFETVAAADLEDSMLKEARKEYQTLPVSGPRWVGVEMPTDSKELEQLTMAEALNGTGPELIPRYYRDYHEIVTKKLDRAKAVDELYAFNDKAAAQSLLSGASERPESLRYFPLAGRDRDLTVLVQAGTGKVVDIVDLRPW